jgi:hypothetical protein
LFAAAAPLLPHVFTADTTVLAQIPLAWWVFVVLQPVAGVVYALDGVLLGAGDAAFLRNATLTSSNTQPPPRSRRNAAAGQPASRTGSTSDADHHPGWPRHHSRPNQLGRRFRLCSETLGFCARVRIDERQCEHVLCGAAVIGAARKSTPHIALNRPLPVVIPQVCAWSVTACSV